MADWRGQIYGRKQKAEHLIVQGMQTRSKSRGEHRAGNKKQSSQQGRGRGIGVVLKEDVELIWDTPDKKVGLH